MNYRLKDKGLQVQLDAISDGDFSRQLEANRGAVVMGIEYSEQVVVHRFRPWDNPENDE